MYRLAAIALIGVVVILGIAIYRNNTRNPDSEAEAMQLKLSKELNEKILQMNAQANARKIRDIPKETKQAPTEIINYAKSNQRKDEPTRAKGFDASALPNYLRISIDKNSSISLTKITPNKFMMGSPLSEQGRLPNESQREVVLTEPFYIGETEVTQAQFISVMGLNPSIHREPTNISYLPVDNASYEDAMSFCRVLSSKFDHPFKLPTEAQWEFACRAATDTPFSFGLSFNGDSANANGLFPYGDSKPGPNLGKTTNVGSYRPNTFNLYDMHGNVWEWCSDWFGDYDPNATTDPSGPPNGKFHVRRGGSWKDLASSGAHRAASRAPETLQEGVTGFRIIIACSDVRQEDIRKKNEVYEDISSGFIQPGENSQTMNKPSNPTITPIQSNASKFKSDFDLFQGEWRCIREQSAGKDWSISDPLTKNLLNLMDKNLSVKFNNMIMTRTIYDKYGAYNGDFSLGSTKKFDWTGTGPSGGTSRMTGLYKITESNLTLIYKIGPSNQNLSRPTWQDKPALGNGIVQVEFKKIRQ